MTPREMQSVRGSGLWSPRTLGPLRHPNPSAHRGLNQASQLMGTAGWWPPWVEGQVPGKNGGLMWLALLSSSVKAEMLILVKTLV